MKHTYTQFDGDEFPTQESLGFFEQVMDFVVAYGEQALKALDSLDPEQAEQLKDLIEQGLIEKVRGSYQLTPRAINSMQRKALNEIFAQLKRGSREGHSTLHLGAGGERTEGSKPYQFGDPVSELDMTQTLRNAIGRRGSGTPIRVGEDDFALHNVEGVTSVSTVLLLDMSGSMTRYKRFYQAKKVALAMQAMIRSRYPMDTLDIVGFYSGAARIPEDQLPLVSPKPVSVTDWQVRIKVPTDQIDSAPQHFTNLHAGLHMARKILRSRPSENKQLFIITDGQPTAHLEGEFTHLIYPPHERTQMATLTEALACMKQDIRFATFALIEDYYYMDWVNFVDQLTRLTGGVAFYCTAPDLASCIMESYMSGKKSKAYIA